MAMPPSTQVLILTGPPGVGKTTTAEALTRRPSQAIHLESDVFFRFIRSGYVEPWRPESHKQNQLVMRIVGDAATAYAAAGYFTVLEGIVIPRWFLAPLRDALHVAGLQAAYAVLRAPAQVCAARFDGREGGPVTDPGVIEQLWAEFADLGEFEKNVIEVEGKSTDVVVDEIVWKLEDGRLAI